GARTPGARPIEVGQRWAARATTSQRTLCARSAWSGCTRARRSATSPVVAVLVMNEPYVPDVAWSSQWFPFALGSVDAVRSSRSVRTCGSSTATPASTRASARNAPPAAQLRAVLLEERAGRRGDARGRHVRCLGDLRVRHGRAGAPGGGQDREHERLLADVRRRAARVEPARIARSAAAVHPGEGVGGRALEDAGVDREPVAARLAEREEGPAGDGQVARAERVVAPGPAAVGPLTPDEAREGTRDAESG